MNQVHFCNFFLENMLQGEYSKLSYIVNKPSNPLITLALLPFTEHEVYDDDDGIPNLWQHHAVSFRVRSY
jgi:hypothetical protein